MVSFVISPKNPMESTNLVSAARITISAIPRLRVLVHSLAAITS